jgi:histidine ammonia-lyase
MNGALKTRQILKNAQAVLAIEAIGAAQALDFRDYTRGKGTQAAQAAVRRVVAHLDEDRPLFPDHNEMAAAVERCVLLEAVEAEIGELGSSW